MHCWKASVQPSVTGNKDKGETWAELAPDLGPTLTDELVSATFVGMSPPQGGTEKLGRKMECSHLSQKGLLAFSG